jgi:hypothetical protein
VSRSKEKNEVPNDEAIRNLLMIGLLKDDVDPAVISGATGIPEKTIRNKFPMKKIKREASSK